MEDCIENNLDKRNFPYLFDRAASSGGYVAMNSRYNTYIIVKSQLALILHEMICFWTFTAQ